MAQLIYKKYWEACDPYDAFLSNKEKEEYERTVLAKHPEYIKDLNKEYLK